MQSEYFFRCGSWYCEKNTTKVLFRKNSAILAGNEIYGGWIDDLYTCEADDVHWNPTDNDQHVVTSNPTRICMCVSSIPVGNITEHQIVTVPGQTIEIEAVAVGQRLGIVPSIVIATLSDSKGNLGEGQFVQSVGTQCTSLNYTVFSKRKHVMVNLTAQDTIIHDYTGTYTNLPIILFQQFSVKLKFKGCPLGFLFDDKFKQCICLQSVQSKGGLNCDTETFDILRTKQKWLTAVFEHNISKHHGVIVHDQCPYDYCRTDTDSLSFKLEFPDDQCDFHRSGVLCGACQHNYSQMLGTSKCMKCSSIKILVIVPATLIAGILLTGFLIFFNLTVSTGTINGLIFYANIVRASQAVFFPPELNNSFISMFIAWLNLDLGVETCFYNGLDAYAKTWFQFVFPLYIWLMVITIIVASHYSTIASRLTPNNVLPVLATLFLLSYAKILRLVIIVFSSTLLYYPDGYRKRVWLYDGNIEFLTGKHIPLFIATFLLLILLSVPYTLSLVCSQWLQRISHCRLLFWVHRLMPLFDTYTKTSTATGQGYCFWLELWPSALSHSTRLRIQLSICWLYC